MRNKSGTYFLLNALISRLLKMTALLRKLVVCARGLSDSVENTDFGYILPLYSDTVSSKYYFRTERSEVIFAMFCGCRCLQRRAKRLEANVLEAVPIGAGTYLDGKCFAWLRQKLLKSVRIPASFFLARQKFFSPICIPSPIGTASEKKRADTPISIP